MDASLTKKTLTVLVVCLFIANIATLAFFWLYKNEKLEARKGRAAEFIIKQLYFSKGQKENYLKLVAEHQRAIRPIREQLKDAKESLFDLLQQPNINEKEKQNAAKTVSQFTEKLDLVTFNHFAAVRKICNVTQQQKFDQIIKQVLQMMGEPRHGGGPHPPHPGMEGPPEDDMPPPPGSDGMLPPPPQE